MNKINQLFANTQDRKLLSLYFCAGCPTFESTTDIILATQRRGIDMLEVGIPFSDPLADGPVIQSAATQALRNGMSLKKLFEQLKSIKDDVKMPLVHPRPALQGLSRHREACGRPLRSAYHHAHHPRNQ